MSRLLEDLRDMFRDDPQHVDSAWLHEEREARVQAANEATEPSRYGEEHRLAVKAMILGDPEPMKRFRERFQAKREAGKSNLRAFTRAVGDR